VSKQQVRGLGSQEARKPGSKGSKHRSRQLATASSTRTPQSLLLLGSRQLLGAHARLKGRLQEMARAQHLKTWMKRHRKQHLDAHAHAHAHAHVDLSTDMRGTIESQLGNNEVLQLDPDLSAHTDTHPQAHTHRHTQTHTHRHRLLCHSRRGTFSKASKRVSRCFDENLSSVAHTHVSRT